MIEMTCPHCGKTLHVDEKYRGKQGTCMHCEGEIVVGGPVVSDVGEGTGEETPLGTVKPESFGAYGRAGDTGWVDPYEQAHRVQTPLAAAPRDMSAREGKGEGRKQVAIALAALLSVLLVLMVIVAWALVAGGGKTGCTGEEKVYIIDGDKHYYPAGSPYIPAGAKAYPKSQVIEQGYVRHSVPPAAAAGPPSSAAPAPLPGVQTPTTPRGAQTPTKPYVMPAVQADAPQPSAPAAAAVNPPKTVYIMGKGTAFHRRSCKALGSGGTEISRSEAIEQGYTPCPACNP